MGGLVTSLAYRHGRFGDITWRFQMVGRASRSSRPSGLPVRMRCGALVGNLKTRSYIRFFFEPEELLDGIDMALVAAFAQAGYGFVHEAVHKRLRHRFDALTVGLGEVLHSGQGAFDLGA